MQVKLIDLNEAQPALNALANTKLLAKPAYRIGKALNKVSSLLKGIEDWRINTLNSMAKLNEGKTKYDFDPPEKEQEFNKLFAAHKQTEAEVPFPCLTLDDLNGITIEPVVLGMLSKVGALAVVEVVEKKDGKIAEKA